MEESLPDHSVPTDAELAAVLAAFGAAEPTEIARAGGTATPKWKVSGSGSQFVLRIRPAEFARADWIAFDHEVLRRLSAQGLPVPTPHRTADGLTWVFSGGRAYELLSWIEGNQPAATDPGMMAGLGRFLARFHAALAGAPPPGKEHVLREDHPDLMTPYLADCYRRASDPAHRRTLDAVAVELERVRRELDSGLYASLPHCVIHGDLHPGNLRFRGAEVCAVYDFDYLAAQARLRDVTDALISFASSRPAGLDPHLIRSLTQPFVPDGGLAFALLQEYDHRQGLADAEWQAMPWLIRSRWIQMRLRGARKVPPAEKVAFVVKGFGDVIEWLDQSGPDFFAGLRREIHSGGGMT